MVRYRLFCRALITCSWSLNTPTAQTQARRLHGQPSFCKIPIPDLLRRSNLHLTDPLSQ